MSATDMVVTRAHGLLQNSDRCWEECEHPPKILKRTWMCVTVGDRYCGHAQASEKQIGGWGPQESKHLCAIVGRARGRTFSQLVLKPKSAALARNQCNAKASSSCGVDRVIHICAEGCANNNVQGVSNAHDVARLA
jgi:hypothetical protein